MATLGIPSNTIEVLQKYHFNFQKKFGQNFLIDTHVLEKIMNAAQISKDDCVVEVGPGIGTMTQYLAERAGHVVAVEIDKALIPILSDTLSAYDNVEVINEDILKVDLNRLVQEKNGGRPIKVVANLPYYITTPIIMGLFESHVPLQSITIMVQKEVADRMQVGPGTKDYGALSLAVQYYAKPEIVANVPPNCFIPRPNVGSATKVGGIQPIYDALNKNYGTISFDKGFIVSSNIAICELLTKYMDPSIYQDYVLNKFKFNQKVDIPFVENSKGNMNFTYASEKLNTGFGQGISVTALQMAQAYTAILNDGKYNRNNTNSDATYDSINN